MSTRNLCITTLFILSNMIWSVVSLVEFSKSFEDVNKIASVQGVTMKACQAGCESRKLCKSAVYYRRASYCIFVTNDRHEHSVVPSKGIVLISCFHPQPLLNTVETCGNMTCRPLETCISDVSGKRTCKVKECGEPPHHRTILHGNMYSVKNKLILRSGLDGPIDERITCGDDGEWKTSRQGTTRNYCRDFNGTTTASSGLYKMESSRRLVYCDMDTDGGHWLVFQRRMDGSENFYRNWADYMTGFGILTGEFWYGLERLHRILSDGEYELRIDMEDWSNNTRFAKYSSFSINDESDNYRLAVSGFSGDCGNSFEYMDGGMFSTLDVDNDSSDGSCAQTYRGGWWYTACHASNLNGLYHEGGNTTMYARTVVWKAWLGHYYSLKFTEMKIRRKL